jgi:predicted methyltransferase
MPLLVLDFLKRYWAQIAVVLIVVSGALYVRHLYVTVQDQKIEIAKLETVTQQCAMANESFRDIIAANNQTVQQVSDFTTQQQKKMDDLATNIATQQHGVADKVNKLLQATKPQSCDDAIKYLIDGAQEYHK